MIYPSDPSSWQDLEEKAASILATVGMESVRNAQVDTVRGAVNVDVVGRDLSVTPALLYLVECKHWSLPVPKTVVHAFRTVVADAGAHVGIIISSRGFQSGAHDAARSANLFLVNWHDFQEMFINRWKAGRYAEIRQLLEDVFEYYDYFSAPIGNAINGNRERAAEWENLLLRHKCVADANPWNLTISPKAWPPVLPVKVVSPEADGTVREHQFDGYASFYAFIEDRAREALRDFQSFVTKYRTGPVHVG
jgi:hypothetical protein